MQGAAGPGGLSERVQRLDAALSRRGLHAVHGTMSAKTLATQQDVEWALPILYQPGSDVPIYLTDQIVLRFDSTVSDAAARKIVAAAGCEVLRHDRRRPDRYVLRVLSPATTSPVASANALHDTPGVVYAHPDFILMERTCDSPPIEDPLYGQQWHLHADASPPASPNASINVEGAWSLGNGSNGEGDPSIRIAVIDDAVQKDHPDLLANFIAGRNLNISPGEVGYDDPSPVWSGEPHGTAVAGIAVGVGNTVGGRGVAPRCGLIGVRALEAPISEISDAFYFAMDPNNDGDYMDGASVINNSWQLTNGALQPPDLVYAINDVATQGQNGRGCVVLFAAANSAHTVNGVSGLAQLDSVICVGASNSFASHSVYSDVGPEVCVVAPTSDSPPPATRQQALSLTTTDLVGPWGYNTGESPLGDYIDTFGGTSAATPVVAGVCALAITHNSELSGPQIRQIIAHTAVQIDPAYAQINGISGHSHRFGYGRVDATAAVSAVLNGIVWPAPVKNLTCTVIDNSISLSWAGPLNDATSVLVVQANRPFAWQPTDGNSYLIDEEVAPGVQVVADSLATGYSATDLPRNGYFFGVYARNDDWRYGWGQDCHGFVGERDAFYDDCEGPDPGWTHGGPGDVWTRNVPLSYISASGWDPTVYNNGPLAGIRGERAIGGNQCWGTGMDDWPYSYQPDSDAYLRTPLIDLLGIEGPAFLTFYDWCLMETPYDRCAIKVLDASDTVIGTLATDYGGDYDWTPRVFDLSAYTNRKIRIQFEVLSDNTIERDGWFIDEVHVLTTAPPNLSPVASDVQASVARFFHTDVTLVAIDPEPGDVLSFTITSLPTNGSLADSGAGPILSVPYTLAANGRVVRYTPVPGYAGPDSFTFHAADYFTSSNEATVTVSVNRYATDFDEDGDVDLIDFNYFRMCFNGSNRPTFPECGPADLDGDHDVDLIDFAGFRTCFNGENAPPPPRCQPMP